MTKTNNSNNPKRGGFSNLLRKVISTGILVGLTGCNPREEQKVLYDLNPKIFEEFLGAKYAFNNQELTIQEQFLEYVSTAKKKRDITLKVVWEGDEKRKEEITRNVQTYFQEYNYPLWVVTKENSKSPTAILAIPCGGKKNPAGKITDIINEFDVHNNNSEFVILTYPRELN